VAEPGYEYGPEPIEVLPVVVVSQTFPARPSSIPEIRDFVRRCLDDSPLSEEGTREVGETVFRALLDAAGATGSIQVAFRIFPEHVEVDVLHSDTQPGAAGQAGPSPGTEATAPGTAAAAGDGRAPAAAAGEGRAPAVAAARGPAPSAASAEHSSSFAEWMANALRREGLTQEQAARQLGVSVKTVSRWLGGETHPRMRDLRRIRDRFGEIPLH
jgi:hypothetical protein